MQPLTIAGRDPGGVIIAFQGRTGARAVSAPRFVSRRLLPIALICAAQLAASGPVRADPVPETMNGVPFLPIPTFEEVGLPPFTMPTGTLSTVPDQTAPPSATGGDGTSSATLDTMLSQSWGAAAGANAESLGVNPTALAATCVLESNCQNVGGTGTINGAFQMSNATYNAAMAAALQRNPNLAANIVPDWPASWTQLPRALHLQSMSVRVRNFFKHTKSKILPYWMCVVFIILVQAMLPRLHWRTVMH